MLDLLLALGPVVSEPSVTEAQRADATAAIRLCAAEIVHRGGSASGLTWKISRAGGTLLLRAEYVDMQDPSRPRRMFIECLGDGDHLTEAISVEAMGL